jgi:hypothetical protein
MLVVISLDDHPKKDVMITSFRRVGRRGVRWNIQKYGEQVENTSFSGGK